MNWLNYNAWTVYLPLPERSYALLRKVITLGPTYKVGHNFVLLTVVFTGPECFYCLFTTWV